MFWKSSRHSTDHVLRVEFFGDEIERISEVDYLTGEITGVRTHAAIFPANHYATTREKMLRAISSIEQELEERLKELREQDKLLEAHRLEARTRYDLEMLQEVGFCRHRKLLKAHQRQGARQSSIYTAGLFPGRYAGLHRRVACNHPQIGSMYNGDRSRKEALVEYGFRPSAFDNRPLTFSEFELKVKQAIYVSATPGPYERKHSRQIVEQIIRPTGRSIRKSSCGR